MLTPLSYGDHNEPRRRIVTFIPVYRTLAKLLAACMALACTFAAAENYPAKIITVKVAFPAGGPADASIRAATPVLQRALGQTLIVDNMPGANGSIAAMNVWKAPTDGYTLLGTTGTDFLVAPLNIPSAKYQPDNFKMLGVVSISDLVLVSSPEHAFKSIDDVIEYAKKPGSKQLSIGHWGTGSTPHIAAADLQARTGMKLLEVPYKGAAPVSLDLAGGQLDLAFAPLGGPTLGLIQKGKLKAIGIASQKRNPALPDVPGLGEKNRVLKDFEYSVWVALLAPPKTPDSIAVKLNQSINEWSVSPENQTRTASGASRALDPMDIGQAASFLKKEQEKYLRVARQLDLKP
jgi:tripartite-type tricarboxylate transporter receptor subunit TctC